MESEIMYTLNTVEKHCVSIIENNSQDSRYKINEKGVFQTLSQKMGTGGNNTPMVVEHQGFAIGNGQANQSLMTDTVGALNCMHDQNAVMVASGANAVAYGIDRATFNQGQNAKFGISVEEEKSAPMVASGANAVVRRLTPIECERLQAFPDGWTDIGTWTDSKGKKHKTSDAQRYAALGNSMALPFWQFLADRICASFDRSVEIASLFDGIGGFPLVFERAGGKAVWASEIAEFPIAVTKLRFPEK